MPGAVRLAAEGAARAGAGLVTVVTRKEHITGIICGRPELLCYGLEKSMTQLESLIERSTVIVLGPGLGQSAWSRQLFEHVISSSLPLLIDADGLNWLARAESNLFPRSNWILTPHPGEAARLLGITVKQVQADRIQAVQELQRKYGGVIVLKGAKTIMATAEQPLQQCLAGNPGMASAGMGDVLSGIIAGMMAQGLASWHAAQAGVVIHATAGDIVALRQGERGLLASDLFAALPGLINENGFI